MERKEQTGHICSWMACGICVMGSVNDGEVKFKDLAQAMYQFFGVKAKDCYRFYTDIRRRKSHSRTYFLDKMQEKLNDILLQILLIFNFLLYLCVFA